MSLWILLTVALFVQEGISTTVLLLKTYQEHYPLLLVHLLWLITTVIQIYLGYYLGKWAKGRFAGSKFERWMERSTKNLEKYIGKSGEAIALIFVAGVISPALAALGAAWLDISFVSVLIFATIGDFFWYLSEWATVLGISQLFTNPAIAIGVVVVSGVTLALVFGFAKKAH